MTAPVVQATLNACLLTTLSNVLAQMISAYRGNVKLPRHTLHRAEALRHELPQILLRTQLNFNAVFEMDLG